MKTAVIGRGNVGSRFASIFGVDPVDSRTLEGLSEDADLYIIAVSDSAVEEVIGRMPKTDATVAHTTGSVPLEVFRNYGFRHYGVIYPFQTISKTRCLKASDIPLLVEANDKEAEEVIVSAAKRYGFEKIEHADSDSRRLIHLTGTFACNFTNAMVAISKSILNECGIADGIIDPLVAETFEKLKTISPAEAQTGPAIRKDMSTIRKHLSMLEDLGLDKESRVYSSVTDYILQMKQ